MDVTIFPSKLSGSICAIPSKSQAHRLLICSALSDRDTDLQIPQINADIEATAACLNALGAKIIRTEKGYHISPITVPPARAELPCGESGSTLRFMLPIVGALGVETLFRMEGRLPERPLSPLWEEMERMGCVLCRTGPDALLCTGKLVPGEYSIRGDVSSQFITGLLFALAIIQKNSHLQITGKLESTPYVDMTRKALEIFGIGSDDNQVSGSFHSPGSLSVEGDWSNGAFFLTAQILGNPLTVTGLDLDSYQGDKQIAPILDRLQKEFSQIDCSDIPDLVPIMVVAASFLHGAHFTRIERLRLKESDRVASVIAMLHALGIQAESDSESLTVYPGSLTGGTVDAVNDHRIAMAAAIAATVAKGPVTILDAHCVKKSYPDFWRDYRKLGGKYEQYIR